MNQEQNTNHEQSTNSTAPSKNITTLQDQPTPPMRQTAPFEKPKRPIFQKLLYPLIIIAVVIIGYITYVTAFSKSNAEIASEALATFQSSSNVATIDILYGNDKYRLAHTDNGDVMLTSLGNTLIKRDGKTILNLSSNDNNAAVFLKNVVMIGKPDKTNLDKLQGKWVEIGTYLGINPADQDFTSQNTDSLADAEIVEAIIKEGEDNITASGNVSPLAIYNLLKEFDRKIGYKTFTKNIEKASLTGNDIKIEILLDKDQNLKQITSASFAGKIFAIDIMNKDSQNDMPSPTSIPLPEVVNYNFISKSVFDQNLQIGDSVEDRERIADIKAMKTAFDIYRVKTGKIEAYFGPNQKEFISKNIPGSDLELFTDPAGKIAGLNGSTYAYRGEIEGKSLCGGTYYDIELGDVESPPCESFFIVSTLSSGQQFQLNSGVY